MLCSKLKNACFQICGPFEPIHLLCCCMYVISFDIFNLLSNLLWLCRDTKSAINDIGTYRLRVSLIRVPISQWSKVINHSNCKKCVSFGGRKSNNTKHKHKQYTHSETQLLDADIPVLICNLFKVSRQSKLHSTKYALWIVITR